MSLLDDFGTKEYFFRQLFIVEKNNETVTQTRCRMYDQQKQKASANLIPDQSSLTEHLRRAKYQAIVWSQCANWNIDYPDPEDYGLVNENGLKPCWFTCSPVASKFDKEIQKW